MIDQKKMLQTAIYHLNDKQPFYGGLLGELTIKYSKAIPTAGITFNQKLKQFDVYINPDFFESITLENRVAVLQHEILHFTNKHLFRLPFLNETVSNEDKKLFNIAGDMAINQYIDGLPKGCVDIKEWKLDSGEPFPTLKTMEQYHELIKQEQKKQNKNPKTKGTVQEQLDKYKEFDIHTWESLDEETKQKMLDEAKSVIKRSIEKSSYSYTTVPGSIQDLLQEIEALTSKLNYKQILRNTIKRTVSAAERESTWKKPNRRYGIYSPGLKMGELPRLGIYIDTSGSISHKELNEFLGILSNFLKVGVRECSLGLWHTELYYKKKYKLNSELDKSDVHAGGTDVNCVIDNIIKTKPDLAIVFTDLYFDAPKNHTNTEVLYIVSAGGNKSHNFPKNYKVIYLDSLK